MRMSRREAGVVATLLLLLGGAVLGPHVVNGGFSTDEWSNSAATQYPGPSGLVATWWHAVSARPVAAFYLPLTHLVMGEHPALHLAWALILAVGTSVLLCVALRELGFEPVHAGLVAALTLVFPYSDSTELWATGSLSHLATIFALGGLIVALRGLRHGTSERSWARAHGPALALYVLAVFTYEAVAPVIALFGLLYRVRAPWRRVAPRWAADGVVVALTVGWVASQTARTVRPLAGQVDHARQIADQGLTLVARTALPFGHVGRAAVLGLLAATLAAAAVAHRLLPPEDEARARLRRWLAAALGGGLAAAAGWAMFIPSEPFYSPLSPGVGNRTNAVAAPGIVLLVYACFALAATLVTRGLRRPSRLVPVLASCVALLVLTGFVREVRRDMTAWERATGREDRVLAALDRTLGRPAHGSTIYTFGYAGYQAPGIPVFAVSWDLDGAVKIHWNDPSLEAYPVIGDTRIRCDASRLRPLGRGWGPRNGASYGRALFVNVPTGRAERINSAAGCRDAVTRFRPGPFIG